MAMTLRLARCGSISAILSQQSRKRLLGTQSLSTAATNYGAQRCSHLSSLQTKLLSPSFSHYSRTASCFHSSSWNNQIQQRDKNNVDTVDNKPVDCTIDKSASASYNSSTPNKASSSHQEEQQPVVSQQELVFLHIGPSGDCWTGPSLFAAKHLQPDYVKGFPILNDADGENLLEMLQDNPQMAQNMYDTEEWPPEVCKS